MTIHEARQQLIDTWGVLASQWGISRHMAQIHALLLVSPEPSTTDDIMETLQMSRGSVSTNIRDLLDWGIVHKVLVAGDRKDYYKADTDMWNVARRIMQERKRRELDPVVRSLEQLEAVDLTGPRLDVDTFRHVVGQLSELTRTATAALDTMSRAETSWLTNLALKIIR